MKWWWNREAPSAPAVQIGEPGTTQPFYLLQTAGMGDEPMRVPRGMESLAHVELCLCLPRDWPTTEEWPVRLLKAVAQYPRVHRTWIAWGQTLGSVLEPAATGGRFAGVLLTAPALLPPDKAEITHSDGRVVRTLAVVPILEDELRFAHGHSGEELDDLLTRAGVTELIDPHRKSVLTV